MLFVGEFQHTIDPKGRIIIPSKLRDQLVGKFIITKGMDGCLYIYTMSGWNEFDAKLKSLPLSGKEARAYERYFYSNADECELDKQGRILIPQDLRTFAGFDKDIYIVGLSGRVEVWDKSRWEAYKSDDSLTPEKIEDSISALRI